MMELARHMGIEVPATELIPLDRLQGVPQGVRALGEFVYAVKRFDRDNQGQKIHMEDFAQVFGVYPEKKYKSASYRNIVEVIWKEVGEEGVAEFIKRFVFNALIGNGDMHIKNFSLIYPHKTQAALAPAYDFVSTIFYLPQETLALNFSGTREFSALSKERFEQFARKAHLPERWVLDIVEQSVDLFFKAWKTVKELPLKKEICSCIEKHFQGLPFI